MTCIAAIIGKDGSIWMGSDSCTSGRQIRLRKDSKVLLKEGNGRHAWLVGSCGNARISDIIEHILIAPKDHTLWPNIKAMLIRDLIPNFQKILREFGMIEKKDGAEGMDGSLLIGINGHLYSVGANFCLIEQSENYAAIGSGDMVALGSLYTTKGSKMGPKDRLITALEAASRFCDGVRAPFHITHVKSPTK